MYIYTYRYVCIYIYIYIHVYTTMCYMCVYIYIYIYIYICSRAVGWEPPSLSLFMLRLISVYYMLCYRLLFNTYDKHVITQYIIHIMCYTYIPYTHNICVYIYISICIIHIYIYICICTYIYIYI